MLSQLLNVLHELRRIVFNQTTLQILGGVGLALARAALVEDDNSKKGRIEEAPGSRRDAAAGTTM